MVVTTSITILTTKYNQFALITEEMEKAVRQSGIQNGLVSVITKHTTTGIAVNESLECLESDIEEFLNGLVPEEKPYVHARMLRGYGSTAGNAAGHLKSLITGNHCHFPIVNGEIMKGSAQNVYFCEFDGPSKRTIIFQVMGE